MLRVLYAIKNSAMSAQMASEQSDLAAWVGEIVNGTWPHQQASGTLLNVLDAPPAATFADTSGTAFLAAVTFRYAALTGDTTWVGAATKAMNAVVGSIDGSGWLRGNVDPYTFSSPLLGTGTQSGSPEGQAFVIMVSRAFSLRPLLILRADARCLARLLGITLSRSNKIHQLTSSGAYRLGWSSRSSTANRTPS
jgi:hypothetical protein